MCFIITAISILRTKSGASRSLKVLYRAQLIASMRLIPTTDSACPTVCCCVE